MKKIEKRRNTPELILEKSLEMFNKQGERKVTTNHIAEQLELSTGNLYYHYGSKDEIILELASRYIRGLKSLIQENTSKKLEIDDAIQLLEDALTLRWKYRFIMHGKFGTFAFNDKIKSTYFTNEHKNIELPIIDLFYNFYENSMLDIPRGDVALLARQFSLLQEAWISMQIISTSPSSNNEIISAGCHYMLKFIYPALSEEWQHKCTAFLREQKNRDCIG